MRTHHIHRTIDCRMNQSGNNQLMKHYNRLMFRIVLNYNLFDHSRLHILYLVVDTLTNCYETIRKFNMSIIVNEEKRIEDEDTYL